MRENSSKEEFKIVEVMPGSKVVSYKGHNVLVGSPVEVVKALIGRDLPMPTHVVISDTPFVGTVPQNSTEFPLYAFLFYYQGYMKGLKLGIIGDPVQVECNLEVLRIALLGLSEEEFRLLGIESQVMEHLLLEEEHFALKSLDDGHPMSIDELVNPMIFDENGFIDLGEFTISKHENDVFTFNDGDSEITVDIGIKCAQITPYEIPHKTFPTEISKFGAEIVGGSSGFSPINPCSSVAICYNSSYLLIDPIPYTDYLLKARGISKNEIFGIFLTHIHDDHNVLLPFLFSSEKATIITTKEIYYMTLYKLALTMNITDYKEMEKYFNFVPVEVDKVSNYYGIDILPHYTLHPIPTIGAKFSINYKETEYSITYVGDNQELKKIDEMYEKGVISSSRRNRIKDIYKEDVDLLIADGGQGLIHGDPEDSNESNAKQIAFIHLDELPDEYKTSVNIASIGYNQIFVFIFFAHKFVGISFHILCKQYQVLRIYANIFNPTVSNNVVFKHLTREKPGNILSVRYNRII